MKRHLPILLLALLSLFLGQVSAQNSPLHFESTRYDFGVIAEDGGAVSTTFICKNTADTPVVILSIAVGCSCTTADYSREPIRPGVGSRITVHFDPMNQPEGRFIRKVIVTTSKGNIPLTISGEITPRKKSTAEQYPLVISHGVRLEANSHAFGYIEHGEALRSSVGVINTSKSEVLLSLAPSVESGLLDIRYPKRLKAGEAGVIDFGYDIAISSGVYGSVQDVLTISVNSEKSRYQLIISGIAIDRREKSEDKEWQKIQLSENFIKFGILKRTTKPVTRTVEVANIGLETLQIRAVECSNSAFSVRLEGSSTIRSDARRVLNITFDPSKSDFGAVVGRVTIVSNDPQQPARSFKVSAIVEN